MVRSRTTTPRRTRGRLASPRRALWLVLFSIGLVAAQLLSAGHLVFVSHALCEHGELTHDEWAAPGAHAERVAPAAADVDPDAPSATTGRDAAEHDHCDPFAVRPALVSVGPACVVPEVLSEALVPWTAGRPDAERPISILALAPKSSPPVPSPSAS